MITASTCRCFSAGQSARHTSWAVWPTGWSRLRMAATASAMAGASRRLRAMLYPVAGCTRLAAAPNAVTVWCATGSGPPTGMYDHSSSITRVTWGSPRVVGVR